MSYSIVNTAFISICERLLIFTVYGYRRYTDIKMLQDAKRFSIYNQLDEILYI